MRTAAQQQTVDNFALWDTFTGYPQGKEAIPVPSLRSPSVHTALLCRSMTRRANRAALRPAHQSPYSVALSSRDGLCTGLYADTPMIPAQHRISPPIAAADMNEKVSSREAERTTGSINPIP